ncbi:hypothetical protein BV881_24485 [Streptomyces sp. ZL-24]|nr:hypothetical protein BV881_24485 [Streptomyces sp. ZL-24]
MGVPVGVDVAEDEAVGASVVGTPPGADEPGVYEPGGYDAGSEPGVPGIVVLGVGGSVRVPAGGGGEGDG